MNVRTLIKICGITCEEDGLTAARAGADFLGFVFYPPSPRYVEPKRVAEIMATVREILGEAAPKAIGVFVDTPPEEMDAIRKTATLDGAQLAGMEPADWCRRQAPIRLKGITLENLRPLETHEAEYFLCDTHDPEKKGGTGRAYHYHALKPYLSVAPIIIAGGLTPETVEAVVRDLAPAGVDVSSALEASPGRKDPAKVRAFVEAVRRGEGSPQ